MTATVMMMMMPIFDTSSEEKTEAVAPHDYKTHDTSRIGPPLTEKLPSGQRQEHIGDPGQKELNRQP